MHLVKYSEFVQSTAFGMTAAASNRIKCKLYTKAEAEDTSKDTKCYVTVTDFVCYSTTWSTIENRSIRVLGLVDLRLLPQGSEHQTVSSKYVLFNFVNIKNIPCILKCSIGFA